MNFDKYKNKPVNPSSIWTNPVHFIACGFGVGCIPWAPGTFGTLLGVLFYVMMMPMRVPVFIFWTLVVCGIAMWTTHRACEAFGEHDHPATVSDEVAGFLVSMVGLPFTWQSVVAAFILFRVFDILKPGPIGWLDKHVHGGVGIVLDDMAAGVAVALILNTAGYLWG